MGVRANSRKNVSKTGILKTSRHPATKMDHVFLDRRELLEYIHHGQDFNFDWLGEPPFLLQVKRADICRTDVTEKRPKKKHDPPSPPSDILFSSEAFFSAIDEIYFYSFFEISPT